MNRQKDIFDLFRERQDVLNETPSAQAWRRLERRLDAHQRRGRVSLFRSLAMVAGVMLIVLMITLISMLVQHQQEEYLSGAPQHLEYLRASDADATAYQVVAVARNYYAHGVRPVEEGAPDKKLVPVAQ